jgi:HPt (histidine-containing phosphotransfer) domain-containing protein
MACYPALKKEMAVTLDARTISDLREIGSHSALFTRVVKLFLNQVPQALAEIEQHASRKDLPTLADQVHAMKSMCVTLGAMKAGHACTALELAARTKSEADILPLLANVIEETLAAIEEAKTLL